MVEVAGNDWIGSPVPPVESAPLFPEGSRKRYDPRAPSRGGAPVPVPPPPVVEGGTNADGSPSDVLCENGLPFFAGRVALHGTGVPHAAVEVYLANQVAADIVPTRQVGSGLVDAAGVWRVQLSRLGDGLQCFIVKQSVPGGFASPWSDPFCCMVGTCEEQGTVPPPIIDGVGRSGGTPSARLLCGDALMTENPVTLVGTGIRGALVKVYLYTTDYVGTQVGSGRVDLMGNWRIQLPGVYPDGSYCVVSTQTVSGYPESGLSNPFCFHIGVCDTGEPLPPQDIDLEAARLRFSPDQDWAHGTLAFMVDGAWVHGVLRRVVPTSKEGGW